MNLLHYFKDKFAFEGKPDAMAPPNAFGLRDLRAMHHNRTRSKRWSVNPRADYLRAMNDEADNFEVMETVRRSMGRG